MNVTETVQLAPAASVDGAIGQVDVCWKSLVEMEMLVMVRADVWLFFTVTLKGALLVPTTWDAKLTLEGVTLTAARPLPDRVIVCGEFTALSTTDSVPERVPRTEGENVTVTWQPVPAARVAGLRGQLFVWEKSERLLEMLVIVSGVL